MDSLPKYMHINTKIKVSVIESEHIHRLTMNFRFRNSDWSFRPRFCSPSRLFPIISLVWKPPLHLSY